MAAAERRKAIRSAMPKPYMSAANDNVLRGTPVRAKLTTASRMINDIIENNERVSNQFPTLFKKTNVVSNLIVKETILSVRKIQNQTEEFQEAVLNKLRGRVGATRAGGSVRGSSGGSRPAPAPSSAPSRRGGLSNLFRRGGSALGTGRINQRQRRYRTLRRLGLNRRLARGLSALRLGGDAAKLIGGLGLMGAGALLSNNANNQRNNQRRTPPPTGNAAEREQALIKAAKDAGITDKTELAQFMAQWAHESGNFKYMQEIWGPTPAQRRYEGRRDLGNTQQGDGYRYRGRGFSQLTGRANYRTIGRRLGIDLENNPDLASQPDIAAKIAIEYWKTRVKPKVSNFEDTRRVTYLVNGGYNGLNDRIGKFQSYKTRDLSVAAIKSKEDATKSKGEAPNINRNNAGVSKLSGVIDLTSQTQGHFNFGNLSGRKGFIIHHTAGRGSATGIINVFKQRNFPTQFIIDREGKIYQVLPSGRRGQHMKLGQGVGQGLSNQNTEGVEVIAKDDSDVLPVQVEAAKKLASMLGYASNQVYGHGEVNPHKLKSEGMTIVSAIRGNQKPATADRAEAASPTLNKMAEAPDASGKANAAQANKIAPTSLPVTVGGTMKRQGVSVAIGRLHPEFRTKLAAAIAEARTQGLNPTVFSAYRPPGFGVGGFGDKFRSLHAYGLAVDMAGIGRPGSRQSNLWYSIATKHGLYNPYGAGHSKEWNHYQLINRKSIPPGHPLRQTITKDGPKNLEQMWNAAKSTQGFDTSTVPNNTPGTTASATPTAQGIPGMPPQFAALFGGMGGMPFFGMGILPIIMRQNNIINRTRTETQTNPAAAIGGFLGLAAGLLMMAR